MVTGAIGWEFNLTLYVALANPSVAVVLVAEILTPAVSLSAIVAVTGEIVSPLYKVSLLTEV